VAKSAAAAAASRSASAVLERAEPALGLLRRAGLRGDGDLGHGLLLLGDDDGTAGDSARIPRDGQGVRRPSAWIRREAARAAGETA